VMAIEQSMASFSSCYNLAIAMDFIFTMVFNAIQ
jgi:hypothetical protein